MPDGAALAWDLICKEQEEQRMEKLYIEEKFKEAYEDAVSKFYDFKMSWKSAESLARLWADKFYEEEWEANDFYNISTDLELDWEDCYAILGLKDQWLKAIEYKEKWG
jgi:hypothetical protein